ncbi:MAG: thiamine pyrophosphate-dependent enzyme [Kiritimatiellia bacterium]|nr:thiamine pyrophosphate-dependent enzyme [Kiritimatiellia bacterium]
MQLAWKEQQVRNRELLAGCRYLQKKVVSQVLPWRLSGTAAALTPEEVATWQALQIETARTAISAVAELAKINEIDHLGGALDLTPALLMTLAFTDYERVHYTIENAHTSIGYYAALASLGYLDPAYVISSFRQGLDIPGHVSWVPGGTQLNGGRLGVMIPAAVGQALGLKAKHGKKAWVICHCGDAGWISGQALNGFNAADFHGAPVTFVMNRNGIQLSGSNRQIFDKDPRPIVKALGVKVIEVPSLHDEQALYSAYRKARQWARKGRPSMIYPTGYRGDGVTLASVAAKYGISAEMNAFAAKQGVSVDTPIWEPGSMMSYRDVDAMIECLFLVNDLPGGKGHHDGNMKGKDLAAVLGNPMLRFSATQKTALEAIRARPARRVVTRARPAPGSANLLLPAEVLAAVALPAAGKSVTPRAGVQAAYADLAKAHPRGLFVVDCDLCPSTKTDKARELLAPDRQFELSIEEQIAALMANGLAVSTDEPQLVVFATFAAFFEGIAREGLEMWRYQRNLNGSNEGLNVAFHLSHVACTGRDHFSGWSLDWVNVAISVLPYLDRFYAPADARSAYVAVRDMAARYGAHILGVPRDNLPVLARQDGSGPLWEASSEWEPLTIFRRHEGARRAILALGATAMLAEQAVAQLGREGLPVDAYVVNGLPCNEGQLAELARRYPEGLVSVEDGLIGDCASGLRGFAGVLAAAVAGRAPVAHIGIVDPRVAPSDGHLEVWEHFGLTADAVAIAARDPRAAAV